MDILFAENSKRQVTELKPETVKDLALMEIVESVADGELQAGNIEGFSGE